MGMFDLTPEKAEAWKAQLIETAQPHVGGEEIVAIGAFRRGGSTASMAAGHLGGLAYAANSLLHKKRAGGLPQQVLLALTRDKLYALKAKPAGRKWKVKGEAAVWNRSDLRTSTEQKMGLTMLTIESPGEGEKATLAPIGVRDDPLSAELVATLAGDGSAAS